MSWTQAPMSHWVIERTSMRWWFLGLDGMGMGILLKGKFNSVGFTLQAILINDNWEIEFSNKYSNINLKITMGA